MTGKMLFVSEHDLSRAENLRAVYEAYTGEKQFERGWDAIKDAPQRGYSGAVVDTVQSYIPNKGDFKVLFIGHGIPGGKTYAFDMPKKYLDECQRGQIDFAACPSTHTTDILAKQLGIPEERAVPLGMPRTDSLVGCKKGDGLTIANANSKRLYLYAPTFRDGYEEAPLPNIRWDVLDSLMESDEFMIVKRHYYTSEPLVNGHFRHIIEIGNQEPIIPFIIDCDVLLTDFSSVSWDAFIAGKPVIMATDGMRGYLKHRGMYWKYPEEYCARWHLFENCESEILGLLRDAAEYGMNDRERELRDKTADMCDGKSSERIAIFAHAMLDS